MTRYPTSLELIKALSEALTESTRFDDKPHLTPYQQELIDWSNAWMKAEERRKR